MRVRVRPAGPRARARQAAIIALLCGASACSNDFDDILTSGAATGTGPGPGASSTAASTGGGGGDPGGAGPGGAAVGGGGAAAGGGGSGGTAPEVEVPMYFTSKHQLFRYHPDDESRELLFDYDGCDDVIDIAIDS